MNGSAFNRESTPLLEQQAVPEPDFDALRSHLLEAGISPRFVRRTMTELRDHYDDIRHDIAQQGITEHETVRLATEQLGDLHVIAKHVRSRTELRRWSYRYPAIGRIALPLLCVAALPIAPFVVGANHAQALVRWGAILALSGLVTAGLFLAMQLSISLG